MLRERRRGEDVAALFSSTLRTGFNYPTSDSVGYLRKVANPFGTSASLPTGTVGYMGVRCHAIPLLSKPEAGTSHPLAVWPRKKPERKPGGKKTCRANIPPTRELNSIFLS